jgi:pimeloyl-ACP methyl ester carboxylesterase
MRIQINDFMMSYQEKGSGIPLLLIHGFPLNSVIWQTQLKGLAEVALVITPDLRGHGESQPVSGVYSMDLLARDCASLLDSLNINQPVVVGGLSMGGYVTLAFYHLFAKRVRGLMLIATRAVSDSPEAQANRDKMSAQVREQGSGAIAEAMLPKMLATKALVYNPILVEQVKKIMESTSVDGIIGDLMGMKSRPDSTPMLPKINIPTLIFHGKDDTLISMKEAEAMHAAIPHSQLQLMNDSGHLLNMEQPEIFNNAVRKFLQSL